MISINEADQRIGLASLSEDDAFRMVHELFNANIERIVAKMMDNKTSEKDTIILKGVINEAKRLSPLALRDSLLAKIEARLAKQGMGVVVVTKKKDMN